MAVSRAQFLRGTWQEEWLHPPWSKADFAEYCEVCDACIKQCPEGILVRGAGRFPVVDFSKGECTFCKKCVLACEYSAFKGDNNKPWDAVAQIGESCLTAHAVECRSCGDSCEQSAIRFRLQVGTVAQPLLDTALCTGCGACVAGCPTQSIAVLEIKKEEVF